jgi:hypothetical protein
MIRRGRCCLKLREIGLKRQGEGEGEQTESRVWDEVESD